MKRFHVHVAVENLEESTRFYSMMFGVAPSVVKPDYAKWMLDDPRVNFAISRRGHAAGVNHLGFQVDTAEALAQMRDQIERADEAMLQQTGAACCYARSDKYWVTDPSGIAWETFHSLESIPVYGEDTPTADAGAACCMPVKQNASDAKDTDCCSPSATNAAESKMAGCC